MLKDHQALPTVLDTQVRGGGGSAAMLGDVLRCHEGNTGVLRPVRGGCYHIRKMPGVWVWEGRKHLESVM